MRAIYPKIDDKLKGIHALRKYINKYKGVEIQITNYDKLNGTFEFEEQIRTLLEVFPNLKEIIIHTPVPFCYIEMYIAKDKEVLFNIIEKIKTLTLELGIKIDLLFHVNWDIELEKMIVVPILVDIINNIKGFNIEILLENVIFTNDFLCPLKICKLIGSSQLKVCLDICHVHCYSNMMNLDINNLLKKELNKKDASKYVYSIHFSKALNNDGFKDKKTHGRMHDTRNSLIKDVELLYEYGMYESIFVPEINEENYETRECQIEEINNLEDIYLLMK